MITYEDFKQSVDADSNFKDGDPPGWELRCQDCYKFIKMAADRPDDLQEFRNVDLVLSFGYISDLMEHCVTSGSMDQKRASHLYAVMIEPLFTLYDLHQQTLDATAKWLGLEISGKS